MTILTTARLRLVPYADEHLDGLHNINSNIEVMRYVTGRAVTLEETKAHIDITKTCWDYFGFSSWSFFELRTNRLIGTGGIQHLEFNEENPLEIGWRLIPEKWGQGFGFEAAHIMFNFAFQQRGLQEILSICNPENTKSEKIMQRLGMRYQGIQQWYDVDTKVYKMTQERYWMIQQYNEFSKVNFG